MMIIPFYSVLPFPFLSTFLVFFCCCENCFTLYWVIIPYSSSQMYLYCKYLCCCYSSFLTFTFTFLAKKRSFINSLVFLFYFLLMHSLIHLISYYTCSYTVNHGCIYC